MRAFIVLLLLVWSATFVNASNFGEVAHNDFYKLRYKNAIKTYQEGLKTAVRLADRKKEVIYLNNIATIYNSVGVPDSCRQYLEKARNAAAGNKALLLIANINTALFNKQPLDVTDEEIKAIRDSLTVFELSALYTAMGRLIIQSNPDKALGFFSLAKDALNKEKKSSGYSEAVYFSAIAEFNRGGAFDALKLSEEAAKLFRKNEHILGIKKCLKLQVKIFQKTNDKANEEEALKQLSRMP